MTEPNPKPPWEEPDYHGDLEMARLARASYLDRNQIEVRSQNPDLDHLFTYNWKFGPHVNNNDTSGFVAYAFVHEKGAWPNPEVVIAIRGSEAGNSKSTQSWVDWTGPDVALAADGDLPELSGISIGGIPIAPKGDVPKQQMAEAQMAVLRGWDKSFEEALDFGLKIRNEYETKGYEIKVTGHSLGGANAELLSHTFGWGGRTYDAAGAKNLIAAPEYAEWCKKHGVTPVGAPKFDRDQPQEKNLVNYSVNDSVVSQKTGPHIGHVEPMTSLGGREGAADYALFATSKAAGVLSEIPLAGSTIAGALRVSEKAVDAALHFGGIGLDAGGRHSMDRIVRVFEDAAETGKLNQFLQIDPGQRPPGMSPSMSPGRRHTPDDSDHPDHAMLEQIRAGVRKIDDGLGKPYDDMSERIARGLLVACKDNRDMYPDRPDYSLAHNALSRVDHVVLAKNGNIFAIQGNPNDPGDPANKRAYAPVEQLARTPVDQSDEKLQVANKNLAHDQVLTEQRELARQKEIEQNAPRMTMGIAMNGPGDGGGGGGGDGGG